MTTYKAPLRDMRFLLDEVLTVDRYDNLPGFADAPKDVRDAILEEGAKFCESELQPLNRVGDREGCTRAADGSVKTPTGYKAAYDKFVAAGFAGLGADPEHGGQGLPNVLKLSFSEMVASSCMAFGMYPGLTGAAAAALAEGGTEEQKRTYLPKMISGEWSGTMNLTEPHAGTDLGLLKTKAVPQADGSYKITGQKIWISSGEHDLTDNIIHLVLARIEGAPEGTKGISLFVAPKFLVNTDGSLGERNKLVCAGLEEKMGIHGNATCVMSYEGATGWLVGEANKGLRIMFVMMNEARIGTGLQGLSQSEVAYQNAAIWARERLQGRSLTGPKNPGGPADPIIVHPDVRRMLMDAKSFNEGARAFGLWVALLSDLERRSPDEKVKEKAADYLALLTPIVKAYFTARGFASVSEAVQVHGGAGYVEETGMAQYLRDCRITMIYEGANGIQALDLVGRKLALNGGRPLFTFFAELDEFIAARKDKPALAPFVSGLETAKGHLKDATDWLMNNALTNFDNAGAASTDYLTLFGHVCLAYMWAQMAEAAQARIEEGSDDPFYRTKLATGRYFVARTLPETASLLAKVQAGAEPVMALSAEEF
jgi:alkylation response protein AidB-like acyl-CoA dehydrogenase